MVLYSYSSGYFTGIGAIVWLSYWQRSTSYSLQWCHNECGGVSNHQRLDFSSQPFVKAQINENLTILRHWLCEGNWPVTSEFPTQRASNAKNVSIWRRHYKIWTNQSHKSLEPHNTKDKEHKRAYIFIGYAVRCAAVVFRDRFLHILFNWTTAFHKPPNR